MRIGMVFVIGSVLAGSVGVSSCATNPVTGQRQLSLVSEAQEIEMGRSQVPAVQQSMGFVADQALQAYVREIGMRMAKASERAHLPWEFHVVDDPMVNAFAAPGGFIFITRGILAHMNSEAELAGVLGHEVSHVTAKHSVTQMSTGLGAQLGVVAAAVISGNEAIAQGANAVATLFTLKYGRDQETQADEIGHRYALMQRYDVREIPKTFMTLQRIGEASGGGSSGPSFLATHPDPGNRVAKTQAWADTVSNPGSLTVDRDEFMTRINGMLYGADPAEGYFENGRFLHPAMRFQFAVPNNWVTANQKAAVILGEPNGQAQIQLSGASQATPQAAMQAFAGQQGVQMSASQNVNLGGIPGVIAEFVATTQQGQLRGQVLYLQHAGSVFQFLGMSTAQGWGSHGGTISNVLRSFRPTAANQVFQRARQIRVVTLPGSTSIASLASQSGGAITAQQLAIINGVEANATLPAGRKVKTVVYR